MLTATPMKNTSIHRLFQCGFCLFVLTLSTPSHSSGQALPDSAGIERLLEAFETDREIDETLLQLVQDALDHPIEINRCSSEDLLSIPLLNPVVAQSILAWREKHGRFRQIDDLLEIPLISPATLEALSLFIYIEEKDIEPPRPPIRFTAALSYRRRLDVTEGFKRSEDGYLGGPSNRYVRLRLHRPRSFAAQVVLESDAGERFSWNPGKRKYGFDHASGYISVSGKGLLRRLVLGDYRIESGQGLMLWQPFGRGKGVDPINDPIRRGSGLRPAASREEQLFFRGIATELRFGNHITTTFFASKRKLDASLKPSLSADEIVLSSISASGLHRTPSEIARRDAVGADVVGGIAMFESNGNRFGITAYQNRFSHPFSPDLTPTHRYAFKGSVLRGYSAHSSIAWSNGFVWGEFASSQPGGSAAIAGLYIQLHPSIESVLLWRRFAVDYHSFYANSFAESRSSPRQETGYYLATHWTLGSRWNIGLYYDTYDFAWLRQSLPTPTGGQEAFLRLTFKPRRWLTTYGQYRIEGKGQNSKHVDAAGRYIKLSGESQTESFRFQLDYRFSSQIAMRSRLEVKHSRLRSKTGMLFYQEIRSTFNKLLRMHVRFALFDSPDQASAVYAYENDVHFQSRITPFSGTGARNFILLRTRLGPHLNFEVKYAVSRFNREVNRGSGRSAFTGNRIREFNAQLTGRF